MRTTRLAILTLTILFSMLSGASARESSVIGSLSFVEGRVDRSRGESVEYVPCVKQDELLAGDVLRTKSYSRAEIVFSDKSVLRLAENSQVRIKEFAAEDGVRRQAAVALERGTLRAIVSKTKDLAPFVIETPNARGTIKGSDMFVTFQKSATAVFALEGKMLLQNNAIPDKQVEVNPRSTSFVPADAAPVAPRNFVPSEQKRLEQQTTPTIKGEDKGLPSDMSKALVSKVSGDVLARVSKDGKWHKLEPKEALAAGTTLETKGNGRVELVLESGRVVQLQPGGNLTIRKLSKNPKTGAREDLFESTLGKIRVSVEKLKADSTFEIKTPSMISGVRGTVMNLNITRLGTQAFFSGGTGYASSLDGSITREVGSGQNASSDSSGNISDAQQTTDQQQQENESGWDPDAETYGYSDPEPSSDASGDENGNDLEKTTGNTAPAENQQFADDSSLFDLQPQDAEDAVAEDDTGEDATGDNTAAISLALAGEASFGTFGSFLEDEGSAWQGAVTSSVDENLWEDDTLIPLQVEGTYANPGQRRIWFGDLAGATSVNQVPFLGWLSGAASGTDFNVTFATLFIDTDGTAGAASGAIDGTTNEVTGTFFGIGVFFTHSYQTTNIAPGDLFAGSLAVVLSSEVDGSVSSRFDSAGGSFAGNLTFQTMRLEDADFGIMRLIIGDAQYANTNNLETWTGGLETYLANPGNPGDSHRFLGSVQGLDRPEDFILALDMQLFSFDNLDAPTEVWTAFQNVLGGYTPQGEGPAPFEGVGTGVYQIEPVTFSGKYEGNSLFYNTGGTISTAGSDSGVIGAAQSPWLEPSLVLAMGFYDVGDLNNDEFLDLADFETPMLWNTRIESTDFSGGEFGADDATYDGGAFAGFTGGLWRNRRLDGGVAALFVAPDLADGQEDGASFAGVLLGNMSGFAFPESADGPSWYAAGEWSPNALSDGISLDTSNFGDNVFNGFLNVASDFGGQPFQGDFDGTGSLTGTIAAGSTMFLQALPTGDEGSPASEAWGVFDLLVGQDNRYSNPENKEIFAWTLGGQGQFGNIFGSAGELGQEYISDEGYWTAVAQGDWANGEIHGGILGTYLSQTQYGVFEGSLFGLYAPDSPESTDGSWIAKALGAYAGQMLAFGANVDAYYHYFDDNDGAVYYDYQHYGLLGSVVSPFAQPGTFVDFVLMGESYPFGDISWWGQIADNDATGGASLPMGIIAGRTANTEGLLQDLDGELVSIYIDPEGNAGILSGTFDGTRTAFVDVWSAPGQFAATQMAAGFDPQNFLFNVHDIDGFYAGAFSGGGEIAPYYGIYDSSYGDLGSRTYWLQNGLAVDEPWGIFGIEMGGYYQGDISNDWTLQAAGTSWRYGGGESGAVEFWALTIQGSEWENQRVMGSVDGWTLTPLTMGSLEGNFLGSFDTYYQNAWEGIALGSFTEQPLDFAAGFDGEFLQSQTGNVDFTEPGTAQGILGGIGDLWGGTTLPGLLLMGTYYVEDDSIPLLFGWEITSYNIQNDTHTTFDGGAFLGFIGGRWFARNMEGVIRGLYIDPELNTGYFSGHADGFTLPSPAQILVLEGDLTATKMGVTELLPENLLDEEATEFGVEYININEEHFEGAGTAAFGDGGFLTLEMVKSEAYSLPDQSWGIWTADLGGTYSEPGTQFQLSLGAVEQEFQDIAWLGKVLGDWSEAEGTLNGEFQGVWISVNELDGGMFDAGIISGEIIGNRNSDTGDWQAVGLGEWVEIAALDAAAVGYTLEDLANFISIPITEQYASVMEIAGGFNAGGAVGAITGVADTSFFSADSPNQGIWTALFSGNFTGMPESVESWTANVTGPSNIGDVSAVLDGLQWTDGQWLANVTSAPESPVAFTGQAGGTYSPSQEDPSAGTFQGVGTGTWQEPQPLN